MLAQVIQTIRQAAAANRDQPCRRGNVVHLPAEAELVVAGDLHGHGDNLLRIEALAGDLAARPQRHVALQELIHPAARHPDETLADVSHHVVARVARWQCRHPGQVHVILGNHELAQMTGQEILKAGGPICRQFAESVRRHYADQADEALDARLLVLGHQPQPTGLTVLADDALIIASDHALGVALQVEPGPVPSAGELADRAVSLAAVALP